jgi:BRCA1-associated protein
MYRIAIEARAEEQRDEIPFSVGNPSVEHVTGTLHLYRQDESGQQEVRYPCACTARWCSNSCLFQFAGGPSDRHDMQTAPNTTTVCVLAVPADMANADLFTFFGSYMAGLSTMRMVRREDVSKSVCMAVLDFKESTTAQSFLSEFNGRPYSTLEPDIICRVVAVASFQMCSAEPSTALEAPAGHTELPTCPVCLERLDTHISGVITTVGAYSSVSKPWTLHLLQLSNDSCIIMPQRPRVM